MRNRALLVATVATLLTALFALPAGAAASGASSSARSSALKSLEARSQTPATVSLDTETGAVEWLSGRYAAPAPGDPVAGAFRFLEQHSAAFAIAEPRAQFSLLANERDDLLTGWRDVYLSQALEGVAVWGGVLGFHYDAAGRLIGVSGEYVPDQDVTTDATIAAGEAEAAARSAAASLAVSGEDDDLTDAARTTASLAVAAQPDLVFYPDQNGSLHLSYVVEVSDGGTSDWSILVDAADGAVLHRESQTQAATGRGIDLRGHNVSLQTVRSNGIGKLIDRSLYMYRHHSSHPYTANEGTIEVRDARHAVTKSGSTITSAKNRVVADLNGDNFFNHGGTNAKNNQRSAVSLARNLKITYNAFRSRLSRNSVDDKGLAVIGNVHLGVRYENAYWHNKYKMMFFGDNATGQPPFAKSLDIVAHEYGHGVSQFSVAGSLTYVDASGAISESYSDIWGSMVDYADWRMGEDLGTAVRVLDAPGLGNPALPATMSDYQMMALPLDNGGVHYNCGIGGYFFACLSKSLSAVTPAKDGRFTAARICYRAYRYIDSNATFRDWAVALRQASIDLYGSGSTQTTAVLGALGAAGMDTIDFGIYDNGWCLDSSNSILQFYVGNSVGYEYVAVKCTAPAGAELSRAYVALNPSSFPIGKQMLLYVVPVAADGGPDMSRSYGYECITASKLDSTLGFFTPVPMTADDGVTARLVTVPSQFYILVGYVADSYNMGAVLCDEGSTPTGRSWVCQYDESSSIWTRTRLTDASMGNNFLIRPGFDYAGGVSPVSAAAGAAAPSAGAVAAPAK